MSKLLNSESEPSRREPYEDLMGLARFAPLFRHPKFRFAEWHNPAVGSDDVRVVPYCSLSDEAAQFVQACYDLGWVRTFDWPQWKGTLEANNLIMEPGRIKEATRCQLSKLLTLFIRSDRFDEGALNDAFERGLLSAITERAGALLRDEHSGG